MPPKMKAPAPAASPPKKEPIDWDARKTVLASHSLPKAEFGDTTFITKFEIASFDNKEPKLFIRTWKESPKWTGATGEGGSWTFEQTEELITALEHMIEVWAPLSLQRLDAKMKVGKK
jgi:hypothetical protein